ncbi:MAG TPA: diguanylate cyclase [Firmicutes bacterium]|nr:diguanylate cyclase [Bacillota bacterium]
MNSTKDRLVWLACGVLLIAWVIAAAANLGLRHIWINIDEAEELFHWNYTPLLLGAALVLAGGVLAWLFYSLGTQELREKAAMEKRFRQILEEACRGTMHTLSSALDLRDDGTYGHSQRVTGYSVAIGKRMGLDHNELQILAWGSLLHDLGKIGIRDEILLKAGPLDENERMQINKHAIIGWQLVKGIPFLAKTADLIRHHHERWDGTGYPDRLKGNEIPLLARIFTVADAFDAMTSLRPYRSVPFDIDEARAVIKAESGKQFCPQVVEAFLSISDLELEEVRNHSIMPLSDPRVLYLLDIASEDISDAYYQDILTGTRNRSAWEMKRAQMILKRGQDLGILVFIDLDGFKDVNDIHGHPAGDRVLADLGARLLQIGCESYRLGGDEFILWFPKETTLADVSKRMESIAANFVTDWKHLKCGLTVSWGVAMATEATESLDQLLYEADRAMYGRKRSNRAGYYTPIYPVGSNYPIMENDQVKLAKKKIKPQTVHRNGT